MPEFTTASASAPHWRITSILLAWLTVLTRHYALHRPEHVGMFAGSLLQRDDWDH